MVQWNKHNSKYWYPKGQAETHLSSSDPCPAALRVPTRCPAVAALWCHWQTWRTNVMADQQFWAKWQRIAGRTLDPIKTKLRLRLASESNASVGVHFEFQTGPPGIPTVRRQTYSAGALGCQRDTSVGTRLVFATARSEIQKVHRPSYSNCNLFRTWHKSQTSF